MVGVEQIRKGAMKYVVMELVPQMSAVKGVIFEAFAPDIIDVNIKKYMATLDGTNLVSGNTVNVEEMYRRLKLTAAPKWPMELAGFKFSESDLDRVYQYIREAG